MSSIKAIHYDRQISTNPSVIKQFGVNNAKQALSFHRSFPEYKQTPLVSLKNLANELGVASIHVKDESYRFGLNAFKVLGGSYCLGAYIAERLGVSIKDLSYDKIINGATKKAIGDIIFVTATDGNHGRGIAWTANRFGQKCVVYMPKGSVQERLDNIKSYGAAASITDFNYDDTVRSASENAEKYGWVLVQDTAWEGYEKIPGLIMQGYTTMAYEIMEQLRNEKPTHIFLQAGVGAMAGAITGFFSDLYNGNDRPIITIVEPDKADCIYRTASSKEGKLQIVTGDMSTIMAGLACGEPCTIGWNILKSFADNFVSMPDYVAAKGMRVLGNPVDDDIKIVSGESGAAALGLVAEVLQKHDLAWLKEQLQLDEYSKILCISTEGDTDRQNYRHIVWDGTFGSLG